MDGLKQRIVGALVLISLAVIFVPMLFDEPHTERTTRTIDLPEEPAFPSVEMDDSQTDTVSPESSGLAAGSDADAGDAPGYTIEESAPVVDAPQAAEPASQPVDSSVAAGTSAPEPAPVEQPSEPSVAATTEAEPAEPEPAQKADYQQVLKGAWLVQLGSFGDEKNAMRLRDKVREQGYAAYTQSVERGDLTLTRVFSGPFVSEDEARSAKQRLDKTFALNSLVMSGDK